MDEYKSVVSTAEKKRKIRERAERAIRGEASWDFSPRETIALLNEIEFLEGLLKGD